MLIKLGRYKHFKGKEYKVIGVAKDSENLAPFVVYQGLYHTKDVGDHPIFIRPLSEFMDSVTRPEYAGPRFAMISESGPYLCAECGAAL